MVTEIPTISTLTLTTANTEYTYTAPANLKRVLFKPRSGGADADVTVSSASSGATLSIPTLSTYEFNPGHKDVHIVPGTKLYFKCTENSRVVEIVEWTEAMYPPAT